MGTFNVREVRGEEDIGLFLDLPKQLHGRASNQDDAVVSQFLKGTHPLSDDAAIRHYLLEESGEVKGRMTLTRYDGEDTLYLGFFECIDEQAAADALFRQAMESAEKNGLKSVTGPMDVSFWIGYRFKTSNFDRVFFGEPENPPYYPKLFEGGGFRTLGRYGSNYYRSMPLDHELDKFRQRRTLARERGVRIIHPDRKGFDRILDDLHLMLMELYQDFPGFQSITLKDFKKIYGRLKLVADPQFIVLAYEGDEPLGFCIAFPDYGDRLNKGSSIHKLLALYRTKRKPKGVVLAYTGVRKGHEGLGGAMLYELLSILKEKQLPAVAALIQEGKVTAGFEKELIEDRTEYRLYRKLLKGDESNDF